MVNRGKFVIVVMLGVGVALGSFAWWNRWQRAQPVLSHWGSDAAVAVRLGEQVELWQLGDPEATDFPAGDDDQTVKIGDKVRRILRRQDISAARGLIHARHSLVQREGYIWDSKSTACEPTWQYVLQFRKNDLAATFALDFTCRRVRLLEQGREADMSPIADALRTFIEQLL